MVDRYDAWLGSRVTHGNVVMYKDYEALEAKLFALVEAAENVENGLDDYWMTLFPQRVEKLKAAIAAVKVE